MLPHPTCAALLARLRHPGSADVTPGAKRNHGLDGLRGIAAMSVALGHCFMTIAGQTMWESSIGDFGVMSGIDIAMHIARQLRWPVVLPHPGMLPDGLGIASSECSRRGVTLSIGDPFGIRVLRPEGSVTWGHLTIIHRGEP